jgi:uncharacterized oligopeptide transporter (OPT) family protein
VPLFQKPPATPAESGAGGPPGLAPAEVAALDEPAWQERAFLGEQPQLTLRAVLTGSALGFLLALTNLYVGLKSGLGVTVAITACVLSFAGWGALARAGLVRTPLSLLESNCMQATASSAGYSTGSTVIAAMAALLLASVGPRSPAGRHLPWPVLAAWTAALAALGVAMALPLRRTLLERERLPFPSGTATAVTLHALYGRAAEGLGKARALLYAALASGLVPLFTDLQLRAGEGGRQPLLPASSPIFDWLAGRGARAGAGPSAWGVVLDHRLAMVGAGALVGWRVSASAVLGGLLLAGWVGPAALAAGAVGAPGDAGTVVGTWVGAAVLVASGLLELALGWRTLARALRAGPRGGAGPGPAVPASWTTTLMVLAAGAVIAVGQLFLAIPWPLGALAIAVTFALTAVACRATGETDVTPSGPLAQLVQLGSGALAPANASASLGAAGITAGASASAADLLTGLRTGRLLGAHPRRQVAAHLVGIAAGTLATTWGFHLLVPDATALTGAAGRPPAFAAPAAHAWLAVTQLLGGGLGGLHPLARAGLVAGAVAGAALALLEALAPRLRRWLPSATGLGLGFLLPFSIPLSLLIGATAAWLWSRRRPASAERALVPVASGMMAGESLAGVLVALLNQLR